jgi:pyruvate dehydrogenase E1 component alpha subunit
MSLFIADQTTTKPDISFKVADKVQQVLTPAGEVVGALPGLSNAELLGFYRWMILGRSWSDRMVALQRQGRMGTFAPLKGQEATSVGIAAPLEPEDWLIISYRENLSQFIKGVPLLAPMQQWGGYITGDYQREARCLPFQVVLGTQMLHAVGVAQAIKYNNEAQVVVAACGDGATSEGDFNEALNFAGVFKAPVIFVVQNNGWAISTPRRRQSAAEHIADRGPAFGLASCVVDGNDVLAVYQVVSEAIAQARAGNGPTLIEAITYRLGAHTTADDPTRYRSEAELKEWVRRDPIIRFRKFLMDCHILTEDKDKALHTQIEAEIDQAVEAYEALPSPDPRQQFKHIYAEMSPQLQRQHENLLRD